MFFAPQYSTSSSHPNQAQAPEVMEGPEALATVTWQPSSARWLMPRGKVLLGFFGSERCP